MYLLLHLVAVVFSEDFEDSKVAQWLGLQLAAVLEVPGMRLAAQMATLEVASPYLLGFEHLIMDNVHYRTPAPLRIEAN